VEHNPPLSVRSSYKHNDLLTPEIVQPVQIKPEVRYSPLSSFLRFKTPPPQLKSLDLHHGLFRLLSLCTYLLVHSIAFTAIPVSHDYSRRNTGIPQGPFLPCAGRDVLESGQSFQQQWRGFLLSRPMYCSCSDYCVGSSILPYLYCQGTSHRGLYVPVVKLSVSLAILTTHVFRDLGIGAIVCFRSLAHSDPCSNFKQIPFSGIVWSYIYFAKHVGFFVQQWDLPGSVIIDFGYVRSKHSRSPTSSTFRQVSRLTYFAIPF